MRRPTRFEGIFMTVATGAIAAIVGYSSLERTVEEEPTPTVATRSAEGGFRTMQEYRNAQNKETFDFLKSLEVPSEIDEATYAFVLYRGIMAGHTNDPEDIAAVLSHYGDLSHYETHSLINKLPEGEQRNNAYLAASERAVSNAEGQEPRIMVGHLKNAAEFAELGGDLVKQSEFIGRVLGLNIQSIGDQDYDELRVNGLYAENHGRDRDARAFYQTLVERVEGANPADFDDLNHYADTLGSTHTTLGQFERRMGNQDAANAAFQGAVKVGMNLNRPGLVASVLRDLSNQEPAEIYDRVTSYINATRSIPRVER